MHEIGRGISANKMCTKRSSGGEVVVARRTSGQERGQRNRVDAPWPRRCIHDIIYPCSPLRYAYARAYVKDARACSLCSRFIRPGRCKLQKSLCDLPPGLYVAAGIPRRNRKSLFSSSSHVAVCSRAILINSWTMLQRNAFLLYTRVYPTVYRNSLYNVCFPTTSFPSFFSFSFYFTITWNVTFRDREFSHFSSATLYQSMIFSHYFPISCQLIFT